MTTSTVERAHTPQQAVPRGRHRVSAAQESFSLALVPEQSSERGRLEQAIARKFESTFGAQITQFLPALLRLKISEELGAVVGIRAASNGPLFLEQYIDRRVEQFVAGSFDTPVDRDQIVEIGNLAADLPGTSYMLFACLATVLDQAGFRWATCTATPQVATMLTRMQFSYRTICSADPTRIEDHSADWGEYYESQPSVLVGDVRDAARRISSNPRVSALLSQFARPIEEMATYLSNTKS